MEQLQLSEGRETAFSTSSRSSKYVASFVIYYCTFTLGVSATFLGPTVVDLSNKFKTDVSEVSLVFTICLLAYLLGAFLNGVVSHFINRQIIVIALLVIGSSALFILPHVTSIKIFFSVAFLTGLFAGGYDSAQVAWIIDIWRHDAPPFILTQHFFYSLGTIVPPLLLSPYLKGTKKSTHENDMLNGTSTWNSSTRQYETQENEDGQRQEGSDLWIPFTVAGCILAVGLLIQILFAISFGLFSSVPKNSGKSTDIVEDVTVQNRNRDRKSKPKVKFPELRELILIALSCCFIAFYTGTEWCTMQFLPTFTHFSKIQLSESEGADVLFGLTMAFCIGRGIGIFLVVKVPPHFIVFGNLTLMAIANSILLVLAGDSVTMMWVGSILLGFSMSTTFPAYFAYIEKYLFISDSVSAAILVCAGGVSAVFPIIVGSLVAENPTVMIFVNFFSVSVLITSFSIISWLTLCKSKTITKHIHNSD